MDNNDFYTAMQNDRGEFTIVPTPLSNQQLYILVEIAANVIELRKYATAILERELFPPPPIVAKELPF